MTLFTLQRQPPYSNHREKWVCRGRGTMIPWIVVFIHGALIQPEAPMFKDIPTLFRTNISGTDYEKRSQQTRLKPEVFAFQPTQGLGLQPVRITNAPKTDAELFGTFYRRINRVYYPQERIVGLYTFGWSGMLNHEKRIGESVRLLSELEPLVKRLRKKYPGLRIRIMSHSHGSNVALNLAVANGLRTQSVDFVIDELIMFGTPVICESEPCICSPIFKSIYHIYSRGDYVERIDIFSSRHIPQRLFSMSCPQCDLTPLIKQVELKVSIPGEHNPLSPRRSKHRIDRSPGHSELWNFGYGVQTYYRWYTPIYPLPYAVLSPAILHTVERSGIPGNEVIFEFRPDRGIAVMRKRGTFNKQSRYCISPYLLNITRRQANEWLKRIHQKRIHRTRQTPHNRAQTSSN